MSASRLRLSAVAVFILTLCSLPVGAAETPVPDKLIQDIRAWVSSPVVLLTLDARNRRGKDLDEKTILDLDKQWRAERKAADQPLIAAVLSSPLSAYLTKIQAQSLGLYTEIFVMDAKGLNAGQSAVTSDYWQGDEAKFQKTFPVAADAVFIDAPEVSKETGTENVQVNMTIADGGKAAGAITVEINLTELRRRQQAGKF